jgi:hypothetical protein
MILSKHVRASRGSFGSVVRTKNKTPETLPMKAKMTTMDRIRLRRLVVALAAAVLIFWALRYLGEYFGVHWGVREVGGSVVRAAF